MGIELFSLEGRVALVTGGNGGLGRAMALGLRDAGARIAIAGRNPQKNLAIAKELGDDRAVFTLDVRDEAAVGQTISRVVERFGRLDILINCAGLYIGSKVVEMERETWDLLLETHLTGSYLCGKHAARAMVERGEGGKIINIASVCAVFGMPNTAAYAAAKSGILGLTRVMAVELAPHNIQVNAIMPGYFHTDMTKGAADLRADAIRRHTPANRWGEPEELVGAAVFLSSRASSFVTGAQITVDGGYSVSEQLLHP